ncbi:MAG: sugar transferase [Bacilli bacterium]|nr:sugar transferase [Bacilli bacterium]
MYKYIKRFIDIVLSTLLLLLFMIPMIIVSICIKLESNGPILFKQTRTGYKGKQFTLYKFRSMTVDNNVLDFSKENTITKVGKFIRKTSLDELPQFINILKGDMSFIGPRPWIIEYAKLFTAKQRKRLDVTPGITGLAQASGRNDISIIDKINYDLEYVDNFSFLMDLKVIFKTLKIIFTKQGADINKSEIANELDKLKEYNLTNNLITSLD